MSEPEELNQTLEVFESTFASIDALIYRCENDADYTMSSITGGTKEITGYENSDILGNKTVSWAGIIHKDDIDRVDLEVGKAIDAGTSWDIDYRIIRPNNDEQWVRERGCAIYERNERKYLQGLVVQADAELALRNQFESAAANAEAEKTDILNVASVILDSIRALTMLSINARIEAARFGDQGKGFAIIAEEIGSLAQENEKLAREITNKINTASNSERKNAA